MKNEDFIKIGDLLNDAMERLFERVKQRQMEEFMEKVKNEKLKRHEKRI